MARRGNQAVRENLTKQLHALLGKPGVEIEDVVFALKDACARRVVDLAPPPDPTAVEQLAIAAAAQQALGHAHEAVVSASRAAKKHADRLIRESLAKAEPPKEAPK